MDFWTWVRLRALRVAVAAYAVVIVLQFVFGSVFDLVTNLAFLAVFGAISRIDAVERWWRGRA